MPLITSSAFFSLKPLTTQPKLATPARTAYTSVSPATGSGLSLAPILEPLYATVMDVNATRPLGYGTREPLNLSPCLFNAGEIYQLISLALSPTCSNSLNLTLLWS